MAEATKVGFQLASSLASKHLTDAEFIKGSYFVVNTLAERDSMTIATESSDGTIVIGSLCYCTADSKFYQYNGTTWVEKTFAASAHAHGKITNDGKLEVASRIVVTDGNKNITVGAINPDTLATKSYVTDQVANAVTGGTLVLTGYATEEYVNNAINALPKITISQEDPSTGDIWFKYI